MKKKAQFEETINARHYIENLHEQMKFLTLELKMLKEKYNDDQLGAGLPPSVLNDTRNKSEHCFELRTKYHGMRLD